MFLIDALIEGIVWGHGIRQRSPAIVRTYAA